MIYKFSILFFFVIHPAWSQEFNFSVVVNANQVQTTDRAIFRDMEQAFSNFLNTRKWTDDTYKSYEKINGTIFLNITNMPSIGRFTANAQITSARPVYNSNYETALINFADRNWDFEYYESFPLEYNDHTYLTNLTSMLAFYAYIILGMDYDSFSELGGSPYFQKALIVATNAQASGNSGWEELASQRNRYALVKSMNNPQMAMLRKDTYQYHRHGIDVFGKTPEKSREIILETLKELKNVWDIYPSSIFIISFFDTKSSELVNMLSKGSLKIKKEALEILVKIDPKRTIYQRLLSQ